MRLLTSAFLVVLVLLDLCPLSLSSIIEPPRDTAALEGTTNVQLNCSARQGSILKWEGVFEWKLLPIQIHPTNEPNSNFTVAQGGSSISINKLDKDLAGIYVCSDEKEPLEARVAAMKPLQCNQPSDSTTVTAGESVTFNCSTSYDNYFKTPSKPLTPTLALVRADGTVVAKTRAEKPGPLSISENVTASAEIDGSKMLCKIYFEAEVGSTVGVGSAQGASRVLPPLYEDHCTFNLNVNHPVSWAKISTNLNESSNVVHVGHTITCEANGRPRPSFEWFDGNDTLISTGDNLTMTMSMVKPQPTTFTCVATNTLPGPLYPQSIVHTARDSIELIVSTPKAEEVHQALAPWAIALIVVIPLLVILLVASIFLIFFLKKRNKSSKPYKLPPKKKPDQSYKNLIYTPTAQGPQNAGPGVAFLNSNQTKSPPPPPLTGSPFTRNDYDGGFDPTKNFGARSNSGHGDLGMSGLSGSRGADLNLGSKGNLQEAGRQHQDRSLSPRPPLQPYGGSSEGLNFPPLPPRQAEHTRYHDNHHDGGSGQKRGRQNHDKARSPPPPVGYSDAGFGRQTSITSTSTNRSASSEGSRVAGRAVEKNPAGRQNKGGKRVASPPVGQGQGRPDGSKRQGKKSTNNRQADTGYPSDVHSLQGSEV